MVNIQAHTMLPATPHRTADSFCDRPHADDGAGDGVRGGHRYAERGGQEQRDRSAVSAQKPLDRFQLRDALAHRLHDAPAAEQRSQRIAP